MLLPDWPACYHPEHGRGRAFSAQLTGNNKRAVGAHHAGMGAGNFRPGQGQDTLSRMSGFSKLFLHS